MEKGSLNAALSCLEGFYTNENVGKHVSALLQASRNSASHFLPPYPLFPPLAPSGTLETASDFSKRTSQQPRAPCSGMPKADRKPKREPSAALSADNWIQGQEKFSWDSSSIAAYNPSTKMFRCIACNTVGFLSRIAEHYLGTHVNTKQVFQCPECPYSSAWSRCVRLHLGKVHGIQNAPESLWRDQPLLDEITGILQNLKNSTEGSNGNGQMNTNVGTISEKRYTCPRCPYATDRRDLYHRHENIHKDDKPFHCYVCFKLFNRADHVKKHFLRIHKNHTYNISLIRRHPPRSSSHSASRGVASAHDHWPPPRDHIEARLVTGGCMGADCGRMQSGSSNRCDEGTGETWSFHSSPAASCIMSSTPKDSNICRSQGTSDESKSKRGKGSGSTAPKTFACAYCPWRGIDGWCLRRHLNTHIKPFTCPFCEYKAARSERLNTHVLKVHGKHLCNKCHFAGEDSVALERHIKEQHLSSSLNDKSRMGCSLYPPFPVKAHQPSMLELVEKTKVEPCGCSGTGSASCNTVDTTELGPIEQRGPVDCVPSEFPCRLCGCLFADGSSLDTHVELAHGGSPLSPTFPYRCALCGFCSFTQITMMEHMRLHTGQALRCRAWEGRCHYTTPFEDVLRDHVSSEHSDDNAVARCPHCGLPCSTTSSLIQHAYETHHSSQECCVHCSIALMRHFGVTHTAGSADVVAATNIQVQKLKQPRKQTKPKKVICCSDRFENLPHSLFVKNSRKGHKPKLWKRLYCRRCRFEGRPCGGRMFRCHSSYLIHVYWCHSKRRHRCSRCGLHFRHGYQSYLHKRKYHS